MKYQLFYAYIDLITLDEAINLCHTFLLSKKTYDVLFLNAHCFNIAANHDEYRNVLNSASLTLNDGIGIKIACKLNGLHVNDNLNGTDLIPKIISLAHKENKRIYLLGSNEEYVSKACNKINNKFNCNLVVGYHSGYFNDKEEKEIIEEINNKNINLLIVGMGVPKQELWIHRNLNNLNNVSLIIAGGAIIDFIGGKFPRAPLFLQKNGLEWAFRLYHEPKRLYKRYLLGNFTFLCKVLVLTFKKITNTRLNK